MARAGRDVFSHITRTRFTAVAVMVTVMGLLFAVLLAPQAAAAAGCGYVKQSGIVTVSAPRFSQSVSVYNCGWASPSWSTTASVWFRPNAGYANQNVIGCTVHIGLVREGVGRVGPEQTADCTKQARTSTYWRMYAPGGWGVVPNVRYHYTGYVNLKTKCCSYQTYPQAASVSFSL